MTITKQSAIEVSEFLDYISNEDNKVEDLTPEVMELLLRLKKLDKKRINIILKGNEIKKKKTDEVCDKTINYTEDEVSDIFSNHTFSEIRKMYTLKELQAMYVTIYGLKASSGKSKDYIINIIGQYYGMSNRAKAFFN